MRNLIKFNVLLFVIASFAVSCNKEKKEEISPISGKGIFILNNGNWNSNDACISFIDASTGATTTSAFETVNGIKLGDLGQDMYKAADGKIYIAVSNSKTIFITDSRLKLISSLQLDYSPRAFASDGKNVYVTLYEGYLGRIDNNAGQWKLSTTKVGPNPEGVAIADGKAWVANSGGYVTDGNGFNIYNNTVSVVDLSTFSETSTVTVNTNPKDVCAFDGYIYVSSLGNYYDIPAALQRIDPSSSTVADIDIDVPYALACDGKRLAVLCTGYDADWNLIPGCIYDIKSGEAAPELLCSGIENAYSISLGKDGDSFVGTSDYLTEGKVILIDAEGAQLDSFESRGINPIRVVDAR